MATIGTRFHRVELSSIALVASGILVGALLVVGISRLRPTSRPHAVSQTAASLTQSSAPAASAPASQMPIPDFGFVPGTDGPADAASVAATTASSQAPIPATGVVPGTAVPAGSANNAAGNAAPNRIAIPELGPIT